MYGVPNLGCLPLSQIEQECKFTLTVSRLWMTEGGPGLSLWVPGHAAASREDCQAVRSWKIPTEEQNHGPVLVLAAGLAWCWQEWALWERRDTALSLGAVRLVSEPMQASKLGCFRFWTHICCPYLAQCTEPHEF